MNWKFWVFKIFFTFSLPYLASAQIPTEVLENNGPDVKWNVIRTDHFNVIFPEGYGEGAQRTANTLEHIYLPGTQTMGFDPRNKRALEPPRRLSVVLRNRHAITNGFVRLGPRKSELFTMPPQDYNFIGSNNWMDFVAVHEFRHVVQFQQSKRGFNRFFYFIFGQNTQALWANLAAPPWFWEGDATAIETAFTSAGRGRILDFNRVFRTNLLEGKLYNYNKQHLRSFRDFVPNEYVFGFHFVSHLRRKTNDPQVLGQIAGRSFSVPFVPFTFSNSMKKYTGKYLVENYNEMMGELGQLWRDQLNEITPTDFNRLTKRSNRAFTNYRYPQVLDDGTVVVFKSGIGDYTQFVRLDKSGNEIQTFVPGIVNDVGMLSSAQHKIVWTEFEFHPRWRYTSYSVIKTYDFQTRKLRRITQKSRYAGASLSPDGKQIVTTLTTEEGENALVVLDTSTGEEKLRFPNAENDHLSMARWSDDGKNIVAIRKNDQQKTITRFNMESGLGEDLLPMGTENFGHPVLYKHYLLYNSPVSGIDNIYAKDLRTGKTYQVTSSKYGAYNPGISPDGETLYYNDHMVDGLDVVSIPFTPESWKPWESATTTRVDYFQTVVEQEGHEHILEDVPAKTYSVRRYNKLRGLINPHSWGPFVSTDLTEAQAGIFLQDILNTNSAYVGYNYNVAEEAGFGVARVSYQGFFPVIDVEYDFGNRSETETVTNSEGRRQRVKFKWQENSLKAGLRVPLLLTKSKYNTQLSAGVYFGINEVRDFNQSIRFLDQQSDGFFNSMEYHFSYFRLFKRSARDINSKWGQVFFFENTNTPFDSDFDAGRTAVRATLYFPGLYKNHSFYTFGAYQHNKWKLDTLNNDTYLLRNRIPKPRGYGHNTLEDFVTLSANYTLPLWYPDLALGPVLNIKRFKANLFYDYGFGQIDIINREQQVQLNVDAQYSSLGGELTVDFNILRLRVDLEVGVRLVYAEPNELHPGGNSIEFLIGTLGL